MEHVTLAEAFARWSKSGICEGCRGPGPVIAFFLDHPSGLLFTPLCYTCTKARRTAIASAHLRIPLSTECNG